MYIKITTIKMALFILNFNEENSIMYKFKCFGQYNSLLLSDLLINQKYALNNRKK